MIGPWSPYMFLANTKFAAQWSAQKTGNHPATYGSGMMGPLFAGHMYNNQQPGIAQAYNAQWAAMGGAPYGGGFSPMGYGGGFSPMGYGGALSPYGAPSGFGFPGFGGPPPPYATPFLNPAQAIPSWAQGGQASKPVAASQSSSKKRFSHEPAKARARVDASAYPDANDLREAIQEQYPNLRIEGDRWSHTELRWLTRGLSMLDERELAALDGVALRRERSTADDGTPESLGFSHWDRRGNAELILSDQAVDESRTFIETFLHEAGHYLADLEHREWLGGVPNPFAEVPKTVLMKSAEGRDIPTRVKRYEQFLARHGLPIADPDGNIEEEFAEDFMRFKLGLLTCPLRHAFFEGREYLKPQRAAKAGRARARAT